MNLVYKHRTYPAVVKKLTQIKESFIDKSYLISCGKARHCYPLPYGDIFYAEVLRSARHMRWDGTTGAVDAIKGGSEPDVKSFRDSCQMCPLDVACVASTLMITLESSPLGLWCNCFGDNFIIMCFSRYVFEFSVLSR